MNKVLRWLAPLCLLLWAAPAAAQIYGSGEAAFVPKAAAGSITVDGVMGETEPWASALYINGTQNWSGGWNEGYAPTADIVEDSWVLYSEDTLYVFVRFEDYELYYHGEGGEWDSDAIYIGVDPQHDPDAEDGDWSGWPWHGADSIRAFRAWAPGFTIRGDSLMDNVDWLNGVTTYDETEQTISVEAAIYVPGLVEGSMIGFNVGGSAAVAALEAPGYGFFSWQHAGNPGGDVMFTSDAYGTLIALPEGESAYGTGNAAFLKKVSPSAITVDGEMGDDEPWSQGTYINGTTNWSGGWNEGYAPTADIVEDSWVLYSEDTLYVFVRFEDYELYYHGEGGEWDSDAIYIGVDPQHDPDAEDGDWSGWPWHGADSIHAFRVWAPGATIRGDSLMDNIDWINGASIYDETEQTITAEAAIYVPGLDVGSQIGFNVGGSAAVAALEAPGYGFFSWQHAGNPGGDVMFTSDAYGTLIATSETVVGVEEDYSSEIPDKFGLNQNYPNPFNPATTIEYELTRSGRVSLEIFDLVGRRVATLINDERPAGAYTVRWDGSGLSSGTYVYQLRVDGDVMGSKLMTLVK